MFYSFPFLSFLECSFPRNKSLLQHIPFHSYKGTSLALAQLLHKSLNVKLRPKLFICSFPWKALDMAQNITHKRPILWYE